MSKCEKATYEDLLTNSHTVFNSLSHMTKQTDRIVSARKVLDFFGGEQSNSFFKAVKYILRRNIQAEVGAHLVSLLNPS